jgi:hypothetical protein
MIHIRPDYKSPRAEELADKVFGPCSGVDPGIAAQMTNAREARELGSLAQFFVFSSEIGHEHPELMDQYGFVDPKAKILKDPGDPSKGTVPINEVMYKIYLQNGNSPLQGGPDSPKFLSLLREYKHQAQTIFKDAEMAKLRDMITSEQNGTRHARMLMAMLGNLNDPKAATELSSS